MEAEIYVCKEEDKGLRTAARREEKKNGGATLFVFVSGYGGVLWLDDKPTVPRPRNFCFSVLMTPSLAKNGVLNEQTCAGNESEKELKQQEAKIE